MPTGSSCRVRVQGCATTASCSPATVVYEITFCSNRSIVLCVGAHGGVNGSAAGVSNGATWARPFKISSYRRYVMTGFGELSTVSEGYLGELMAGLGAPLPACLPACLARRVISSRVGCCCFWCQASWR